MEKQVSDDRSMKAKRLQHTANVIKKQMRIAKAFGLTHLLKQPHRLAKHHALDCGNPDCFLCGNPRKTHKDKLTQQEKRLFQDVEQVRDKRSNGLPNSEE